MNVHSTNTASPSAPHEPVRRGRPLVDDKRRKLLDAALRVFAAHGYDGTSVPEVAKAADVAVGSVYHYFRDKEALVNEVYRDAKTRLRAAIFDGLAALDVYAPGDGERWFGELWARLATFAEAEPDGFRFLEMQDHAPYLDARSRQLELSVLAPLYASGQRLAVDGTPVDVMIALLWGAFVGIVKANRLGYLRLDARRLADARDACWRMIAPSTSGIALSTSPRSTNPARSGAATSPRSTNPARSGAPTPPRPTNPARSGAPTPPRSSKPARSVAPTPPRPSNPARSRPRKG